MNHIMELVMLSIKITNCLMGIKNLNFFVLDDSYLPIMKNK